uniref:Ig-like domain-containing protein n=1 Tax=Rodentolepis nana TaxID=102285 RepID=A0A0R3T8M7_RODNA
LRAECIATPPGYPVGALFWRWHFHHSVYQTPKSHILPFHSKDFGQVISAIEDVPTSFYDTYTNGELKAVLNIPNINRRYHGANLSCETAHDTGVSKRVDVNIKIQFPPQNLTITLKNNQLSTGLVNRRTELIAYAEENAKLNFVCTTDEMYPDAKLKWVLHTEDRAVATSDIEIVRDEIKTSTRKPEAFIRESEVIIKMLKRNQYGYLDCQMWYEGTNHLVQTVRLGIIYPPDPPIIKGLVNGEPLRSGESRRLTCECLNGHPPPRLQWMKNDQPIASTFTQRNFRGGVSLDLELIGKMEDNGATLRCVAMNQAQNGVVKSANIALNMYFPVTEVKVSINRESPILAENEIEVNCEAGSANPPASIQWRYFHCSRIKQYMRRADHSTIMLTSQAKGSLPTGSILTGSDELAQDCEMDERTGIDDPTINGSYGGFISRGRLILRPQWRDHLDIVTCLVSNSVYNHLTKQSEVQLNVSFTPHFIGFQPGHVHTILEGSSGTLDLIPYGNPKCEKIVWMREGRPLPTSKFDPRTVDLKKPSILRQVSKLSGLYQFDELLVIWNIKRIHTTNVTIQAENNLGKTQATFLLNVTFPAQITRVKDANVSLNEMAILECLANGNPSYAESVFQWNRRLYPGWDIEADKAPGFETSSLGCNGVTRVNGNVKHLVKCENIGGYNMRSQLQVYNVTRDDVGLYVCKVNNGIFPSHQSDAKLFSVFAPEIVKQPKFAKVAAPFGKNVDLQCFVRVEPEPKVVWQLNRRDHEGSTTVVRVLDSECGSFVADLGVPCIRAARPKFVSSMKKIRPGYYSAILRINGIHVTDFGKYTCKISSKMEKDQFDIQVTGTGPAEVPFNLRLLNASANSLKIAWGQGFNGGHKQTFTVSAPRLGFLSLCFIKEDES